MKNSNRYIAKKAKDLKVKHFEGDFLAGYTMPSGYGVYDTVAKEFVIISDNEPHDFWRRKYVAQSIADQFNTVGATCGNDNLLFIDRFDETNFVNVKLSTMSEEQADAIINKETARRVAAVKGADDFGIMTACYIGGYFTLVSEYDVNESYARALKLA